MAQDLERSVIRILNQEGRTAGTGFLFEECPGGAARALTCAHVVRCAGAAPGQDLRVQTYLDEAELTARVETRGWSEAEDTAFLLLIKLPAGCQPARVGSARGSVGHEYSSLGFPKNSGPAGAARPFGKIDGVVKAAGRQALLELIGESMGPGMSGAPVLDLTSDRVVGMVASHRDEVHTRVIYAITLDALPRGLYSRLTHLRWESRGLVYSITLVALLVGLVFLSSRLGLMPVPAQNTPTPSAATLPAATPDPSVLPPTASLTIPLTAVPTAAETSTPAPPAQPTVTATATPTLTVTPTDTITATATASLTPTITPTPTLGPILDPFGHIMMPIPAGSFDMGSESGQADERPVHAVYLDTFYIDKYEVTNAQYRRCVEAGVKGCTAPHDQFYKDNGGEYDDYPVGSVKWTQAQAYCEWRGGRLPSEAQWEKSARGEPAARGTAEYIFPWGNSLPTCDLALFDGCARDEKDRPTLRPVGSYPKDSSGYGVHDMAGSMIEWVYDWYGENYYEIFSALPYPNPLGPNTGTLRVTRGGGWSPSGVDNSPRMRLTNRETYAPLDAYPNIGFRCVSGY